MPIKPLLETVIETKALTKTFNQGFPNELSPVKGVDLSIGKGQCVVMKGPSGSGKSTLLSLLSCLSKPSSGSYSCIGQTVSKWSEKFLTKFRLAHIGIVFQHFQLISGFTAYQNIGFPLWPTGLSAAQIDLKISKAAQLASISHRLTEKVEKLSGGEMQRVAIARALVNEPTLLFADEPTAHLDSLTSFKILEVFSTIKASGGTLLITTHDSVVEKHPMVDRVITVSDGNVSG